jgi:hypothetical protein
MCGISSQKYVSFACVDVDGSIQFRTVSGRINLNVHVIAG